MSNSTYEVRGADGQAHEIQLIDTGTFDASGRPLYKLAVDAVLDVGDIALGAVELKDGVADTRAKIGVVSGLAVSDNGLPVAALLLVGTAAVSQVNPVPVSQTRVVCAAADVHVPAVNTAAVVTYAADATKKHVITGVAWSYTGGTPVGGNLKIEDVSGTVVFSVDIDKSGPGSFEFPRPKIGAAVNTAMIITLAAGGAGVTGKISVENHFLE
jgi:hypothetical protein